MDKELLKHLNEHTILLEAMDQAGIGITISDPNLEDNPIIFINQGFIEITGYTKEEVLGKSCRFLQGENTDKGSIEKLKMAISERKKIKIELINYRKNGEEFWNELTISPIFSDNGKLLYFIGFQKDITSNKTLELYKSVIENTLQGVIITDVHSKIVFVNRAFSETTGYKISDVIGKNPNILSSQKHSPQFYKNLWISIKETGQWKGEIWNKRKCGEIYPEFLNILAVKNNQGKVTNYIAIFSDITDRKETEEKLRQANKWLTKLSTEDCLIEIANRRAFDIYLEAEWNKAFQGKQTISLLLMDIDYFKKYNDTYGHQAGDECLKMIGDVLKESIFTEKSIIARYGGEEFAIVLPEISEQEAYQIGEKIRINIETRAIPHATSSVSNYVTISVGVATTTPTQYKHYDVLIKYADEALYAAKRSGRNKVNIFSEIV